VVVSTGFYVADTWPEQYRDWPVPKLAELFERELREGIDDSGIKPGHIKCAVGELEPCEHRALLAAAEVAGRTGATITVHPGMYGNSADGRRIAKILIEAGVDPTRLVIAHGDAFIVEGDLRRRMQDPSSLRLSLDYHHELLDQGVNISFDCFGHRWALPALGFVMENDWERLAAVTALVREGYGDRLLLGTDVFIPMLTRRLGGFGYVHLWRTIIPLLREVGGVSDWDIQQMTVESPRRLLTLPKAL
jgi:phosphotriesterase-related protein